MRRNRAHNLYLNPHPGRWKQTNDPTGGGGETVLPGGATILTEDSFVILTEDGKAIKLEQ